MIWRKLLPLHQKAACCLCQSLAFRKGTNITTLKGEAQDLETFIEYLLLVVNVTCMDENKPWIAAVWHYELCGHNQGHDRRSYRKKHFCKHELSCAGWLRWGTNTSAQLPEPPHGLPGWASRGSKAPLNLLLETNPALGEAVGIRAHQKVFQVITNTWLSARWWLG